MFFGLKRSCRLLILGLLFSSTTGCSSSITEAQTAPSVPEPKIVQANVELIPSVNARITKIQFFESGRSDVELRKKRTYERRFAQATTRTVYTEIHVEHPQPKKRIDFAITLICSRGNGTTFRIEEYRGRIEPDWTSSDHWIGVGNHSAGDWDAGTYQVDVYISGEKVAAGSFEIYQ
jgi:hypothetical protein